MILANYIKEIVLNDVVVVYNLQYKNVKNINLRIKSDGSIYVSANKRISLKTIEDFLISKSDFILRALEKYKNISDIPLVKYYDEKQIKEVIILLCKQIYPYFEEKGVKFPEIRFRKMISRWGSCIPSKCVITFNINLMYAPIECIDYVVKHEFTHFLQPNHQKVFYEELSKICPNWKNYKNVLKSINIKTI